MRVCDLNTGLGRLAMAFSDLKLRWQETHEVWQDQTARDFEKEFLQAIPRQMQQLISATQQLAQAVEAAQRECDETSS